MQGGTPSYVSTTDAVQASFESIAAMPGKTSTKPLGGFLSRRHHKDWQDDDAAITAKWNDEVCPRIQDLAGPTFDTRTLCKPSGRLDATLTFVLHYPTWKSSRPIFGSTYDPSNPCLAMIYNKMGAEMSAKVQDRYMMRHEYAPQVRWEDELATWPDISRIFRDVNRFLNQDSKVLVFVGRINHESPIEDLVPVLDTEEVCWVKLDIQCRLFGEMPGFEVIREQVLLPCCQGLDLLAVV
jgi:hypothetical protein